MQTATAAPGPEQEAIRPRKQLRPDGRLAPVLQCLSNSDKNETPGPTGPQQV
jgi:hypothetical protein